MTKITKFKKGFTLVEIILYMALLSIFLITLVDILVSLLDVQVESQATSAVDIDSRYLVDRFGYDAQRASAITMPVNAGDISNNLILTIGGVNYTYSLSGGNLVLGDSISINNLNSSQTKVTSATFQKIKNGSGKDTVKIDFVLESEATRNSGKEVRTIETVVATR